MISEPGRYLSFDAVAEEYDETRALPAEIAADVARFCGAAAHLQSGGLFLDAGVGTGRFGAALAQQNPGQLVGVDISLPMMRQVRKKTTPGSMMLVNSDLQRLPFRSGAFCGALVVHILHLIERWQSVIAEIRRVLAPHSGVLLLGSEQGGRSALVDRYYDRARALGVLRPSLGSQGLSETLNLLKRQDMGAPHIEPLSAPYLTWERRVTVAQTLSALARRTYSQTWAVPDDIHAALMADAEEYGVRAFGDLSGEETLKTQFALYAIRWP